MEGHGEMATPMTYCKGDDLPWRALRSALGGGWSVCFCTLRFGMEGARGVIALCKVEGAHDDGYDPARRRLVRFVLH